MSVGAKVVVIGGGDVALDAARSAIRLQVAAGREPDVTLVYRRTKVEMPANAGELDEARDEGLKVEFLVAPVAIEGADGAVAGVTLERCALGAPDESGRREPLPIAGSRFTLAADSVIFAVGQAMVADFLAGCEGVRVENDQIRVAPRHRHDRPPRRVRRRRRRRHGLLTAVEAIAAGRRAAAAIHNHLRGETLLPVWLDAAGGRAARRRASSPRSPRRERVPQTLADGARGAATGARSRPATPPSRRSPRPRAAWPARGAPTAVRACAPARRAPSTWTSAPGPRRSRSAP